ncbi:MAG: hypothetical protein H7Y18_04505 [Clostridiaceae bacterium]|nr:hypothetical protein [Clostridiaceae bacterium]
MIALKDTENTQLTGDVEADDTFLAYSQKGCSRISDRNPKKNGTKYCIGEHKKVFLLVATDHSNNLF